MKFESEDFIKTIQHSLSIGLVLEVYFENIRAESDCSLVKCPPYVHLEESVTELLKYVLIIFFKHVAAYPCQT